MGIEIQWFILRQVKTGLYLIGFSADERHKEVRLTDARHMALHFSSKEKAEDVSRSVKAIFGIDLERLP